jgi:hypothetical protein
MIKLIIFILVICLIVSLSCEENFIVNTDLHITDFRNIHSYFRRCTQNKGIYSCIQANPYKSVVPYRKYVPKRKKVDYTRYKKISHLMPISFD